MRTLFDHLNLKLPVWSAGMGGGLAGPALAAAVSEAGGLGVLGVGGALPGSVVRAQLEEVRRLTSRPVGANIILPMSDGSDVEACFDARVPVLVLFWGDPQPYVNDAHRRDMFVVAQVGSAAEAVAAADAGVDAVMVQGTEAGGHVKATAPLAETVRAAVREVGTVPVIAAGGIATGKDLADALALGAVAASLGTRFLASREAEAFEPYKDRLVRAGAADTVLTELFDGGWPNAAHRVLRNRCYDDWEAAGSPAPGNRPREGEEVGVLRGGPEPFYITRYSVLPPIAGFDGDIEAVALYAGESVERIRDILPASEIAARLLEELRTAVR